MPSIRDFSGGVVNQELQNSDNGAGIIYDCKNVLSSWNGEMRKRTGTNWLKSLAEYNRIIPYRMPSGDDILLAISAGTIKGYQFSDDEHIAPVYEFTGTAPTFPTTGWDGNTTNGNYTISLSSTAATSNWGKGFDTPITTRPMTYYGKGSLWSGGYTSTTNTVADITISSSSAQLFRSAIVRWTNTCNGNHSGHYKGWLEPTIQYSDDGTTWVSVETSVENPYPTGGATYYQASYHYGSGSSEKTENYTVAQVTNLGHVTSHTYWRIHFARRITNTQTYDGERIDMNISSVTYVSSTATELNRSESFFTESNLDNIKFAQNNNLMILTNGTANPLKIQYAAGAFTIETYTTTLDSNQGFPTCVTFYQNRLWLGGFSAYPTRVWGSAFGNFTDFTIPSTVLSTSPISADSVEIQSVIENMWAGNNALYCLSADGISMIDAQGGIVATDQIEFKLRNREPVNNMTPTYKDDVMIYLGRNKKKILITDYDYIVQRFKAQNISLNYDEFFSSGIRELHYIPNKASLVYGLLKDGSWFAILFDTDRNKNAVFPFKTEGSVYDVQPIKHGDLTELILVVERNGSYFIEQKIPQQDLERMDFMTTAEKQAYTLTVMKKGLYLDCMYKKHFDTATTTISDLPFDYTADVSVIADGSYLGHVQLTAPVGGSLYAWSHDSSNVYTSSATPSVGDNVLNDIQQVLTGYSITSATASEISVHYTKTTETKYTTWRNTKSIVAGGVTYSRNASGDGYKSTRGGTQIWGFSWGTPFTYAVNDLSGNIYTGAWVAGATITDTSDYDDYYVLGETQPAVGDTVYNSSFTSVGTITAVGSVQKQSGVGTYLFYYIEFNNMRIYSSVNNGLGVYTRTTTQEVTETFARNVPADIQSRSVSLTLDNAVNDFVIGYDYDAYAVLKFVSPYNLRKTPKEISVNFINSGYLEVGNSFDSLKSVLNNLVESVSISDSKIFMNGNYTKTLDKQIFETPYVIVRSDKGLPFMITGIDYKVDMSNYQGGV